MTSINPLTDHVVLIKALNIREHYPSPQASSYHSLPEHRAVSVLTNTIVDLPFRNVLCQAEVTDLNHTFILHQNIPCSQIPVDVPLGVQIVHPLEVQQYRSDSRVRTISFSAVAAVGLWRIWEFLTIQICCANRRLCAIPSRCLGRYSLRLPSGRYSMINWTTCPPKTK